MASFDKLTVGQDLWDYHKYKMGHTKMTTMGKWRVSVKEIDMENRRALCSWNGNTPRWYSEFQLKRLKVKQKENY